LDRASALDPDNVWTNYALAVRRVEKHDLPSAYRTATELLRRRPDSPASPWALLTCCPATVPVWAGFPLLIAYLERRPADEIAAMAATMEPVHDPEMNYFAGAHLAYAEQTQPALKLLRSAVAGGYCRYRRWISIRCGGMYGRWRSSARSVPRKLRASRSS
jgi:hypothetical protein